MADMDVQLQEILKKIVDENGINVLLEENGRRAAAFMADYLPHARKERRLLKSALEEGIAAKIYEEAVTGNQDPELCRNRYVLLLTDQHSIERTAAEFIIDSICRALGLKIERAEKGRVLERGTLKEDADHSEIYEILKEYTVIGEGAFDQCKCKGFRIPGNIKRIRKGAFYKSHVTGLILEGETELEPGALNVVGFSESKTVDGFVTVRFPSGSKYLCTDGCIVDQKTRTLIGLCSFHKEDGLRNIYIPSGTVSVPEGSIPQYMPRGTVHVPESVEDFHFRKLDSAAGFAVAPGNRKWKSIDGVLYDSGGTTLLKYPGFKWADSMTVPAGVRRIEERAFYRARGLENVILNDDLREIGEGCFFGCSYLKKVSGLRNVVRIGRQAFALCMLLNSVELYDKVIEIGEDAFRYCGIDLSALSPDAGERDIETYGFILWRMVMILTHAGGDYIPENCTYVPPGKSRFSVTCHGNAYVRKYCGSSGIECIDGDSITSDEVW